MCRALTSWEHPHVDYGYALTSHSSQGATAHWVLVHVDTQQPHKQLAKTRLACVYTKQFRIIIRVSCSGGWYL